jgi:hypothetical protein
MKIFVAYGFNGRDRWIPDLVFPIIEAFGDEIITGEELQGQQITNAVIDNIKRSDALIGFAMRRGEPKGENQWDTHRWVTDEISQAIANNKRILEILETGVDAQGGIAGDRQRILYDESKRDRFLVELVKVLGNWHQSVKLSLQMMPDSCVQEIRPFLKNPRLQCTYRLLYPDTSTTSEDFSTTILPIKGGLFINAQNVQRMSLIQVSVECDGMSWTSDFENTDSFGLILTKEKEE